MYSLLNKYSTGKIVIIFFVITQVIGGTLLFGTIPDLKNYSDGFEIFDLLLTGYSQEYAKELLDALGTNGRQIYLYRQIPVDMVYPFMFAISYSLLLTYFFKRTFQANNKINHLSILPVFAGMFDYLENICIAMMLYIYPSFSYTVAKVSSMFTILKSVFTTFVFILLITGIIKLIFRKLVRP